MGIVSYAQNFEDVLLNRVFGSLHYAFYVDIGAYNPIDDSVTKSFYDRGWDGINVEPGEIFDELAAARPRDINLHMAVFDHSGEISFVQHPGWYAGLSHVQGQMQTQSEALNSQTAVEIRTVPCDTLTNILARYGADRPIAFLKIDAEGSEEAIIRSTNWRLIRPTVLLIEATKPRSTVLDNQHWEPTLLEHGYQRAYFDGINCYYVPDERADLLRHFDMPVNVLDGFQRYDPNVAALQARAAAAEADLHEMRAELARSSAQRDQEREQNEALRQDLQAARDELATARHSLEGVPAAQTAAIGAVVEANTYQLADLRGRLADMRVQYDAIGAEHDERLAILRREHDEQTASLRRERDGLLGVRDQAAQLRRLMRELKWPGGPGALRLVLPLARFLRGVAGTKVPPIPPEEYALLATAPTGSPVDIADAPPTPAEPPRRSIGKRAARLVYRPLRPIGRPAALRLRAFLTMQLHTEFLQLEQKLRLLRDDLARVPVSYPAAPVSAADPKIAELHDEIRRFGKMLEDTLLTIALDGSATRPTLD